MMASSLSLLILLFNCFLLRTTTACGGFWCTLSQPVNQARENIIFAFDQEKKQVTAIIQIMYQGPSENFAWILPVPVLEDLQTDRQIDRKMTQ